VIVARSVADALVRTMSGENPQTSLFTAPRGGPLRSSSFRKAVWLPARKNLTDIYPDLDGLRVHDLRHTAASLAISAGGNIKAVQRMLGHKNASVTLDRYGHLYDEDLVTLAVQMEQKYWEAA
jgi:integrase